MNAWIDIVFLLSEFMLMGNGGNVPLQKYFVVVVNTLYSFWHLTVSCTVV